MILKHGIAEERQSLAARCQSHHAVPWRAAAGATHEHARRHLVLRLECLQLAAVLVRESRGGRPKYVRHSGKGVAGEIGRRPEVDLGCSQVDWYVRPESASQLVGEQPTHVV